MDKVSFLPATRATSKQAPKCFWKVEPDIGFRFTGELLFFPTNFFEEPLERLKGEVKHLANEDRVIIFSAGNPSPSRNKTFSHGRAQMTPRKKNLLESGFFR